jgi:hypothetical protein
LNVVAIGIGFRLLRGSLSVRRLRTTLGERVHVGGMRLRRDLKALLMVDCPAWECCRAAFPFRGPPKLQD